MIRRYSKPEMAAIFSEVARFEALLEVEILATEAWVQVGVVPAEDAKAVRDRAPKIDAEFITDVDEREAITNHDLAAFVDVVQDRIGPPAGKWVHYGLTSSDVVDTAQCWQLVKAADVLLEASNRLIEVLKRRAEEWRDVPMAGRTHGMHAEPTTMGTKLALWALQADRDRRRLRQARETVAVGKLSGAVGTYSNIDPKIEAYVCNAMGLEPVPATQVIARDRHAEFLYACAAVGSTIELISTEIRHLQRSEVSEAAEGFRKGQKGSSAMPHKRNPITAERLSGLARVLRGYLQAGLEDVALWHERDISHSSVERVILPDASLLAHYVLVTCTNMIENMTIDPARMLVNLDRSFGLLFSQPVLLALVESGMTRDDAYRIVQRDARQAWEEQRPFRSVLEEDAEASKVSKEQLDQAFDLKWSLRNIGNVFDVMAKIEG
jgi:adenylosuccinate lyase